MRRIEPVIKSSGLVYIFAAAKILKKVFFSAQIGRNLGCPPPPHCRNGDLEGDVMVYFGKHFYTLARNTFVTNH